MRVILITRPYLEDTNRLVRKAARHRGLALSAFESCAAGERAVSDPSPRLIYRAATDWNAKVMEKLLARPGDALLHDPHFPCDEPEIRLAQAGVPMPRAVFVPATEADDLAAQVDWLGGWPLVLKPREAPYMEPVIRVGNMADLTEQLEECGYDATIESHIPHVRRWRITVLGDRVIAASVRRAPASSPVSDPASGSKPGPASGLASGLAPMQETAPTSGEVVSLPCQAVAETPPEAASRLVREAAQVLRQDFGTAHLLEAEDGALTMTKFDFPCAFADQQARCRVDIAGHMLEHLASKIA